MGVKGLFSLIQEECPEARRTVSIDRMASYHRKQVDCEPVLVVDGANFIPWLYTHPEKGLECIYGGQWKQFRAALKEFVSNVTGKGIKLVFIFDGIICKEKIAEWVKRRMDRYKRIDAVFDNISQNLQDEVVSCTCLPTALKSLAKLALKALDVEVYQTDTDVDPDNYIAEYANKNSAVFAILSNDTDFIIFDTKPVLSISDLNLKDLETVRYDRQYLAERCLNITVKQLPLFTCLMGNDFVPLRELREFHSRLANYKYVRKSKIAGGICRLIQEGMWSGDFTNERELASISREVFGLGSKADLIKRGLESYEIQKFAPPLTFCVRMNRDFENAVRERHFNCENICIYNVLCKNEYGSSEVYEDGSRPPSALIYREIRQRCYGLLFNCFAELDRVERAVVEERCWFKKSRSENNDLNRPEKIHPLRLRKASNVPKIEELWFDSSEAEKFELFRHVLGIPMKFDLLFELPPEQVVLSCLLNYLIREVGSRPLLEPLDVAAFVAQAAWRPSLETLEKLERPRVHSSTVNLSTLFVSGIEAVVMAMETCDLPIPRKYVMPWRFFDGKLFHYLHNKAKMCPKVWSLCDNRDEIVKRFYELLPIVTDNTAYDPKTFEWRCILRDFELE